MFSESLLNKTFEIFFESFTFSLQEMKRKKDNKTNKTFFIKNILIFKNSKDAKKILNCDLQNIDGINKEIYKRLFVPLYIFLIGVISSALILKSKNNKNFNFFKLIIFLCGFAAIIFSEISSQFVSLNIINNLLLTLIPIIISLVFYIFIKINLKFN